MNKIFFKKPTKQVEDFIKQRGKLVIYLTNGKYVTFTKEELGYTLRDFFQLNADADKDDITVEPMRSKILEAAGTVSKSCITRVIDKYGVLIGLGHYAFQRCSNLEDFFVYEDLKADFHSWNNCSKLKNVCMPKLYIQDVDEYTHHNWFSGCTSLEKISLPGILDFHNAYSCFSGCINLRSVDLRNVKKITGNNPALFSRCTLLKKLSFPKCATILPWQSSGTYFSFNAPNMEVLDMPMLSTILTNDPIFRTEVSCKKAILGQIPLATIQAKSAWGLPAGCEVIGKDGSYVI